MNNNKFHINLLTIAIIAALIVSCGDGLAPINAKSYLKGKIIYKNGKQDWPPKDSVFAVRVVAFKIYPPKDILGEIIAKNAYFTPETTTLFSDTASFEIEIPESPVELKYIAVAQQYDSSIIAERAIGVYSTAGDQTKPSSLLIEKNKSYYIEIFIDFKNPPPQPF